MAAVPGTSNSTKAPGKLESFIGSNEELNLQRSLRIVKNAKLMNIVIESCNAKKPVSFTKADIFLQPYDDFLFCNRVRPDPIPNAEEEKKTKYLGVSCQQLFQKWIIDDVIDGGLKSVPPEHESVVLCLMEYLRDMDFHESAISKVRKAKGDETSLCAALGEHFFSRLIPGHAYVIDDTCHNKPEKCPCQLPSCSSNISKGCTGIGLSSIWHGCADIFLDQKASVPVCLVVKDDEASDDDNNDDDDDDDSSTPPSAKKMKVEADVGVCIEVKNKTASDVLLQFSVIDQIMAEAITNAFAQIHKNACLKGWLIPTIGCSAEQFIVIMYDPENDVLLQSSSVKLWGNSLAVVLVWMFLNFTSLSSPNLAISYGFVKSRFHLCAGNSLELYKKATCRERIEATDTNFYASVVMPWFNAMMELVK